MNIVVGKSTPELQTIMDREVQTSIRKAVGRVRKDSTINKNNLKYL